MRRSAPRPGRLGLRAALGWLFAGSALLALALPALAQPTPTPAQLSGTLAKARATGAVTLGYRESSIPFSYLPAAGEPIGYTIDLCRALVAAIGSEVGRELAIRFRPVSAASRIPAVTSGEVDLECGSTTNNLERQKEVAFSPTFFVSGTKLMVKRGTSIASFRELAGKRVAVTAGTTNEKALRDLARKFQLDITLVVAPDHEASYALLAAAKVDAFATDDVLLYGLLARHNAQADYAVVGDFLSYDPYGVMFRKGDPDLTRLVNDTFHRLAEDGEIERRYKRWFLQKLPSGVSLDLPMSPQLETLIQTMVVRSD